jgi:hypothetical protein
LRHGTLASESRTAVRLHLEGCAACRGEFERLAAEQGAPQADPTLLVGLREQIQKWQSGRGETAEVREELRRKVVLELAPFIGDAAAGKLLAAVSDDGRNLLSTLEPVLAAFLGISAAAELINHLVDSAIY